MTTTDTTERKQRTITLTDRPPVRIFEDDWPVVAIAKDWDGQHENQANRKWTLRVRQHEDGRAIVYGVHTSAFQNERNASAGELLESGANIAAAIVRIASNCRCESIAQACIADLPAEEL